MRLHYDHAMVIDARQQIRVDLERTLTQLRTKLAETHDKEARRALKREMRAARSNARRLGRTAIW